MSTISLEIKFYKENKNNVPKRIYILNWIKYSLYLKNIIFNICLLIVNKKKIKELNFKYRNINSYTNILTFNSKLFNLNNKNILYCDIVICKKILEEESYIKNKNLYFYWAHIIIHGCLHIIGYDHNTNKEFKKMKYKEISILSKFNFKNPYL